MKNIIFFIFLLVSTSVVADAPPFGDVDPEPTPKPLSSIPIDGGISAFLIAGMGLGFKLMHSATKNKKQV